ncbi:Ger(x)C family spore germination protein [Paenibacillus mesotrionivorans]|uniref:Ger(X)C family spore germination protein n=1 Tax=Paenibacillus mesotrionivorans TaxID=3160968 RepID=A0ACC7PD69_9BACL
MINLAKAAVIAGMLLVLPGCWDMREAQNTNFITAIGVDYAQDHYVVYAQLIDFTSIAKRESGDAQSKSGSKAIWVGKGEGKSMMAALNHIYDSSQQQTVWTHVKAVILSESVMKSKMDEVFSSILRSREMRYTPWIYGTRDSMEDLLSSMTLLNLSAQTTVMFEPTSIYRQSSDVEPIHLQRLMNGIREPASTVLVPSITSQNRIWTNAGKQPPLSRTDGLFVVSKNTLQGYVPESKIRGTRFVKFYRVFRYPMTVNLPDSGNVLLLIRNPRTSMDINPEGEELQVTINLITRANMIEKNTDETVSFQDITEAGIQKIKDEIKASFEQGQRENMDLLGLEEELYRKQNAVWKAAHDSGEPLLPRFKLKEVQVKLEINHANTYTFRQK